MSPAFVYSPEYDFHLPESEGGPELGNLRLFDGQRATRAWELAQGEDPSIVKELLAPRPIGEQELLSTHPASYLATLADSRAIAEIVDVPEVAQLPFEVLIEAILRPQIMGSGGTLVAMGAAFECGLAINLSGGYHHARKKRGEGFCIFSDIAIAANLARQEHGVARVAVIDLDAHQGNGVSSIFIGDEGVGIFDVYNGDIYPSDPEARRGLRWDHPLPSGCDGEGYMNLLERELPRALDDFDPQFLIYNAGTDLVAGDPLGGLRVEAEQVRRRDTFVLEQARHRGVPTIVTASGGYSDLSHQLLAQMILDVRARCASGDGTSD